MKPYPRTRAIRAHWAAAVDAEKTDLGFEEWVDALTPEDFLSRHGLYVSRRDLSINRRYDGAWQVTEHYEIGTTTDDASDGPWAIVSDDRDHLVKEAISHVVTWWPLHKKRKP